MKSYIIEKFWKIIFGSRMVVLEYGIGNGLSTKMVRADLDFIELHIIGLMEKVLDINRNFQKSNDDFLAELDDLRNKLEVLR